jgi:hypothetical protein
MAFAMLDSNCVAIAVVGTGHTASKHHIVIPKTQTSNRNTQNQETSELQGKTTLSVDLILKFNPNNYHTFLLRYTYTSM